MQRRVPNDVRSFLGAAVEKAAVYLQCFLAISKVYVSTTMHQPQRTERPVLANGFQHAVAIPETEKWGVACTFNNIAATTMRRMPCILRKPASTPGEVPPANEVRIRQGRAYAMLILLDFVSQPPGFLSKKGPNFCL